MGTHTNTPKRHRAAENDVQRVMDSFRRVVQAIRVASRAAERNFGLSAAQLFVLQRLGESGTASINELARRTLTHQSSVSVVVQRLVEKKLVRRNASSTDRRSVVLSLTPKGHELVKRAPQAAQDRLIEAIRMLPHSRRGTLAGLLEEVCGDSSGAATPAPLFFEDSKHPMRRK